MKKDFVFAPALLVIGVLLFLLRATGMTAHLVLSVVGLAVLVVYTVTAKKNWKIPALEIGMRVCYGLALISGIVVKIKPLAAAGIAHRVSAVLFVLLLVAVFVQKMIVCKRK